MKAGPFQTISIVVVLLFCCIEAFSQNIVIRSTGPNAKAYPQGKELRSKSRINLVAGDVLTILNKDGSLILRGPGSFVAGPNAVTARDSVFRTLIRNTNAGYARIAVTRAMRGGFAPPTNPNIWLVDISKSGRFCLTNFSKVEIFRGDFAKPHAVSLTSPNGFTKNAFSRRRAVQPWPIDEHPVAEGRHYLLERAGAEPVTMTFVKIRDHGQDLAKISKTLIKNGCDAQMQLILNKAEDGAV